MVAGAQAGLMNRVITKRIENSVKSALKIYYVFRIELNNRNISTLEDYMFINRGFHKDKKEIVFIEYMGFHYVLVLKSGIWFKSCLNRFKEALKDTPGVTLKNSLELKKDTTFELTKLLFDIFYKAKIVNEIN